MKYITRLITFILALLFTVNAQVTPTNEWVNFYSAASTYNGEPIPIGSIVSAYDPDGVQCGSFEVHTSGQYGFLAVYRDDFTTQDIDEGANPGDTLTFYINDQIVAILGPGLPVWTNNGDVIELNLEGHSNYEPVIIGLPDSLIFKADSTITLDLNEFVEDLNDPDSTLHWIISGSDSVIVNLDEIDNFVTLSAPIGWAGTENLVFTVTDDSDAWDSDTIVVKVVAVVGINRDFNQLVPKEFCLHQNYPNPFNPSTMIRYDIPMASHITLTIYNMNGQVVDRLIDHKHGPGHYLVSWDAPHLSSGVYFYKIKVKDSAGSVADGFHQVKKMLLIK